MTKSPVMPGFLLNLPPLTATKKSPLPPEHCAGHH
jgi:hypothetical protein